MARATGGGEGEGGDGSQRERGSHGDGVTEVKKEGEYAGKKKRIRHSVTV
jgi:hypothetical protein